MATKDSHSFISRSTPHCTSPTRKEGGHQMGCSQGRMGVQQMSALVPPPHSILPLGEKSHRAAEVEAAEDFGVTHQNSFSQKHRGRWLDTTVSWHCSTSGSHGGGQNALLLGYRCEGCPVLTVGLLHLLSLTLLLLLVPLLPALLPPLSPPLSSPLPSLALPSPTLLPAVPWLGRVLCRPRHHCHSTPWCRGKLQ